PKREEPTGLGSLRDDSVGRTRRRGGSSRSPPRPRRIPRPLPRPAPPDEAPSDAPSDARDRPSAPGTARAGRRRPHGSPQDPAPRGPRRAGGDRARGSGRDPRPSLQRFGSAPGDSSSSP